MIISQAGNVTNLAFIITCEHGGNRIPSAYRALFNGYEHLLHTHRGYDFGALRIARDAADALSLPLTVCTVSRLLIDLNRSIGHPKLYSEATRKAPPEIRQAILNDYYLPYRTHVEEHIAQAIETGSRVIHISSHSFSPEMDGKVRNADIGLLYDPARPGEAWLCRNWRSVLKTIAPELKVRMNYPYAGTSDGFTVHLRRRFPVQSYLGIELELNQRHVLEGGQQWRMVRHIVVEALRNLETM